MRRTAKEGLRTVQTVRWWALENTNSLLEEGRFTNLNIASAEARIIWIVVMTTCTICFMRTRTAIHSISTTGRTSMG